MEYQLKIDELFEKLHKSAQGIISKDEYLKDHTYFKIGGPAAIFAEPENEEDLRNILHIIKDCEADCFIIGNGTNLLVSDEGFKGVIIKIGEKFNYYSRTGNTVTAGSGVLLSFLAKYMAREGLAGFEFASGIPGYLGGAVCMNAGAYGGEMKQVVKSVKCMDFDGNIHVFSDDDMEFSYRNSKINSGGYIVIEVDLELKEGNRDEIAAIIKDLNERRITKQPLNLPSAGSTFKRPAGGYASRLIDEAGLKGLVYKGAMVSDKHCGFIVNIDNAACEDVLELMRMVISTVYDKFGIKLEPEVKIIGTKL